MGDLMMAVLKIRDVMTSPVVTQRMNSTVSEAASTMCAHNIGSLVIVDSKGKPVGIVTERDMLRKIIMTNTNPTATEIDRIMSRPIITGHPKMDLEEAANLMIKKEIKRLPITESGKLVGMITLTDIVGSHPQLVSALEQSLSIDNLPKRFRKRLRKMKRER
jgi:CBS domain-containing protein